MDLCPTCAEMDERQISELREKREADGLKKLLDKRVRCYTCAKELKKGKKRKWICELGQHDCRWEGHEIESEKLL